MISSKGEAVLSACIWELCVNSKIGSASAQVSGFAVQYIERYASIFWFTHSVPPLVWGWNAVESAD